MRRPWHIWLTFGLCLAVVLAAMGWLTAAVVRLDRAQTQSRREAAFAENVRLALWRMDSALAPLVAQENARPYFSYSAFYPLDRAYARMFQDNQDGNLMVPSVLLTNDFPNILLHFQVGPDGQVTSPQLPSEAMMAKLSRGKGGTIDKAQFDAARRKLEEFRKLVTPEALAAAFPPEPWGRDTLVFSNNGAYNQQKTIRDFGSLNFLSGNGYNGSWNNAGNNSGGGGANSFGGPGANPGTNPGAQNNDVTLNPVAAPTTQPAGTQTVQQAGPETGQQAAPQTDQQAAPQSSPQQLAQFYLPNQGAIQVQGQQFGGNPVGNSTLNVNVPVREQQQARDNNEFVQRAQVLNGSLSSPSFNPNNKIIAGPANIQESALQAAWVGQALLLVRRVSVDGKDYLQGCWLDWPAIRGWLAGAVTDLLPRAQLAPATPDAPGAAAHMLATLPVKLAPGPNPIPVDAEPSALPLTLSLAWGGVLLATLAAAVLLQGALSLSERRGAFVSAVTHELRTPLTTFRLYSEMLADGMVTEETKRKSYLGTLRVEADRLSHLVENVLAYARLERGRSRPGGGPHGGLWARIRGTGQLRGRAEAVTVGGLLERVTARLGDRARQAGMEVVVDLPGDVAAATLRTDGAAVEQILFNLVDNACKYAGAAADKRIVLAGAVEEAGGAAPWPRRRPRRCVVLRVRDFGAGISTSEARKLFRPFSKTAHEAAHSAPGVGLGLALCRRLARSLGGNLTLEECQDKQGACFNLRLPMGPGETSVRGATP